MLGGGKVLGQARLLCRDGVIVDGHVQPVQKRQQFSKEHHACLAQPAQRQHQLAEHPQVAGIHGREGDALAALAGHVQAVVPIGALEADDVVLADVKKGGEVLHQQVLEDAAAIDLACRGSLLGALFRIPCLVCGLGAPDPRVLKVRLLL